MRSYNNSWDLIHQHTTLFTHCPSYMSCWSVMVHFGHEWGLGSTPMDGTPLFKGGWNLTKLKWNPCQHGVQLNSHFYFPFYLPFREVLYLHLLVLTFYFFHPIYYLALFRSFFHPIPNLNQLIPLLDVIFVTPF
jgi:hypothetical protein